MTNGWRAADFVVVAGSGAVGVPDTSGSGEAVLSGELGPSVREPAVGPLGPGSPASSDGVQAAIAAPRTVPRQATTATIEARPLIRTR